MVEEKINIALQIDNLLILPNKYKTSPYEIITDKYWVEKTYEYQSWKDLSKHQNILSLKIKGTIEGKEKYVSYKSFDKRTGEAIILSDLFSEHGFAAIAKRVCGIEDDTQFTIDNDTICINKDNKKLKKYSLKELKPYLSDYGMNLLFNSQNIVKRNSLREKFMRGTGKNFNGDTMIYKIYISDLDKKGNALIYYWNEKYKSLSSYSEATIKAGILQADDYYYDKSIKQKVHNMYSLHLERQNDGTWVGDLQLGSPFYRLIFKEY